MSNNTQVVLEQIINSLANVKVQNETKNVGENITIVKQNNSNEIKKEQKPIINKCTLCNKKTGLLGFSCQCGGNFCALHRHLEAHNCVAFNTIKNKSLENLAKQNQRIVADKIIKI